MSLSLVSFQPSFGHISDSDDFTMIAYKFSALRQRVESDLGSVCSVFQPVRSFNDTSLFKLTCISSRSHFCGLVDENGGDHSRDSPFASHDFTDRSASHNIRK